MISRANFFAGIAALNPAYAWVWKKTKDILYLLLPCPAFLLVVGGGFFVYCFFTDQGDHKKKDGREAMRQAMEDMVMETKAGKEESYKKKKGRSNYFSESEDSEDYTDSDDYSEEKSSSKKQKNKREKKRYKYSEHHDGYDDSVYHSEYDDYIDSKRKKKKKKGKDRYKHYEDYSDSEYSGSEYSSENDDYNKSGISKKKKKKRNNEKKDHSKNLSEPDDDNDFDYSQNSDDSASFYDEETGGIVKPPGPFYKMATRTVECFTLLRKPRYAAVAVLKLFEAFSFLFPLLTLVSFV